MFNRAPHRRHWRLTCIAASSSRMLHGIWNARSRMPRALDWRSTVGLMLLSQVVHRRRPSLSSLLNKHVGGGIMHDFSMTSSKRIIGGFLTIRQSTVLLRGERPTTACPLAHKRPIRISFAVLRLRPAPGREREGGGGVCG